MSTDLGAKVIAQCLHDLGVQVIFGLVGLPVTDIAEHAIDLGVRFIGFRNEQACSYAATAYGYLTGKPGICLLVGGPGVINGMAGIANASANAWPTLFLGGSSETSLWSRGGFQEMDAISLLTPHCKTALRPHTNTADAIIAAIQDAYRICWFGRPGPSFVDLPTDFIMTPVRASKSRATRAIQPLQGPSASPETIHTVVQLLSRANAPLVIIGKGAAYARAERSIREFIDVTGLPFLPTPMGKGVVADSHPCNVSASRSLALKRADVVLLLSARLNWLLHHGSAPKYRKDVKLIAIDLSPEQLGCANSDGIASLSIFGDVAAVVSQISSSIVQHGSLERLQSSQQFKLYLEQLRDGTVRNERRAQLLAARETPPNTPLTFERAFHIIKHTIDELSDPAKGEVVYIGEGSQTMDISRPIFTLDHPRQKLDAGTNATMGVGLAYCIAAYAAYNLPTKTKKIVAFEGDSAMGFAAMEVETMMRHEMDVLIFCMNNSGIYSGDTADRQQWKRKQEKFLHGGGPSSSRDRLKSSSLTHEVAYEQLAKMVGGRGIFVRSEEELTRATREGFLENRVTVINVIIEPGSAKNISFAWMEAKNKSNL